MGSTDRPTVVSWWLKNARPMSKIPTNIDLASLPEDTRRWWKTILPSWRVPAEPEAGWPLSREVPADEDWQCARRGGPNGLFLVIMCLYWWRSASEAENDRVAFAEYVSVVEDVAFVLGEILKCSSLLSASASLPSCSRESSPAVNGSTKTVNSRKAAKRAVPAANGQASRSLRSSEKSNRRSTRSQA